MGIVSSSLTTGALRVVWVCQMLLDPKYSSVEDKENESPSSESSTPVNQQKLDKTQQQQEHQNTETESTAVAASDSSSVKIVAKSPAFSALSNKNRSSENNNSLHQQNRNRRAQQLRFKTRPSSFDAALIVRGKSKNSLIVTSSSSPLRRQNVRNVRVWKVSSSSGCSSDSCSNSDSETELRVSENVSNEEDSTRLGMSAEEEAAFRLTVGRGHFSRSKKDRFLNHLRLEKRLNDISYDCFGMPCGSHHRHPLQRRHSGDLHRII